MYIVVGVIGVAVSGSVLLLPRECISKTI